MIEFIMTVGAPASGKSTWAHKTSEKEGYVWLSSDNIRKDYDYNISNSDVFSTMFIYTEKYLHEGCNIIYDATNLSAKRRKSLIDRIKTLSLNDIILFRCEVFVAPIEVLKERNSMRLGAECVPEEVINRMIKSFQFPQYFEGWDIININNNSIGERVNFNSMKSYDQNSKYHSLDLQEHTHAVLAASYKLNLPITALYAAWYHDIGKPFCRTEGADGWSHYYKHENVSAYMFILEAVVEHYSMEDILSAVFLINYHMRPYNWTQKAYKKDEKLFGSEYIHMLKLFHQCDAAAH